MNNVRLYGPKWSAYVRTVRLFLIEKEVEYELLEVDFSNGVMPDAQFKRHPFGKVPALDHDGYQLYETTAIGRYIDAAFPGPSLQPTDSRALGRMAQIIAILDAYISEEIRMGVVNEGLIKPMIKSACNQERLDKAFQSVAASFRALSDCTVPGDFLVGDTVTLADLHAAPLFEYLTWTPGGADLVKSFPVLHNWWTGISDRPSIMNTTPDLSAFVKTKH